MQCCLGRIWAKSFGIFIGKNFCQYNSGHKIESDESGGEHNRYGKELKHIKNLVGKSE
jgi:hypothetical protein